METKIQKSTTEGYFDEVVSTSLADVKAQLQALVDARDAKIESNAAFIAQEQKVLDDRKAQFQAEVDALQPDIDALTAKIAKAESVGVVEVAVDVAPVDVVTP